jgi:hypothetical protein
LLSYIFVGGYNKRLIRVRQTWQSEGYGFVEFFSHALAEKALQDFYGHVMPNPDPCNMILVVQESSVHCSTLHLNEIVNLYFFYLKFLKFQVEGSRFVLLSVAMEDPGLRFSTLCRLIWRDGSWTTLLPFSIILCCRYWTVLPVLKYCFSYDTTINNFIFTTKEQM